MILQWNDQTDQTDPKEFQMQTFLNFFSRFLLVVMLIFTFTLGYMVGTDHGFNLAYDSFEQFGIENVERMVDVDILADKWRKASYDCAEVLVSTRNQLDNCMGR